MRILWSASGMLVADAAPCTASAPLKPGWHEAIDRASGSTYYYHESGETSWSRPEADNAEPKAGSGWPLAREVLLSPLRRMAASKRESVQWASAKSWPPSTGEPFPWNMQTVDVWSINAAEEPQGHEDIGGPFAAARAQIDYSYHRKLIIPRRVLHDKILRCASKAVSPPPEGTRPWVVFTAGAMGVGKSFTLLSLEKFGCFPLSQFQQVDPDKLKGELPELRGYLQRDAEMAATRLHRESTHLSDLLFEHSLQRSRV